MARINEIGDTEKGQYALGRLRARKFKKDGFKKGNEVGKYAEKARDKSSLYTKTVDGCNDTFYSPSKYKNLTDSHANGWHDEIHKNESKNMKKGIKLTESELKMVIEGAVRNILKEYGDKEATRAKMALAAKKSLNKGDTSTYNNAINSLAKRGSSKKEMSDFQDKFEKTDFNEQPTNNMVGENQVKITEAELKEIIRESVKGVLAEIDWRTVANAADIAGTQSMDEKLPQGLRRKRTDQWQNFKGDVRPRMMKQYDLSNDEVSDAIKGKGPFYKSASRKALRNMDKLNADYDKFYGNDREHPAKYENGKWQ